MTNSELTITLPLSITNTDLIYTPAQIMHNELTSYPPPPPPQKKCFVVYTRDAIQFGKPKVISVCIVYAGDQSNYIFVQLARL